MNLTRRFFIKAILGTFAYVTLPKSMSTFEMPQPEKEIELIEWMYPRRFEDSMGLVEIMPFLPTPPDMFIDINPAWENAPYEQIMWVADNVIYEQTVCIGDT